jgi:uncharacterized membrane protein
MWVEVLASCATPPPSGQECNDTVALGPIPDWVVPVVLGVIALVVVLVALRSRRRR